MVLKGRDLAVAGLVCFVAWGYAVSWLPALRWAVYAFVAGCLLTLVSILALILLTSRGGAHYTANVRTRIARPRAVEFVGPLAWRRETSSLRVRQIYEPAPLYPDSRRISHAIDELLTLILRDFVRSWYSHISANPVFANEVDKTVRIALANIRDRLLDVDLVEVAIDRVVPILTAHFRDFNDAERAVRGRKLNRSVTETEELDLAIAGKYRDGRLHAAASLAYSDSKTVQQEHLRKTVAAILPKLLPQNVLNSRAVSTIVREIVGCAVLFPVMTMLCEPDTWNQIMENYGRTMLQDRSTVRKLRAALDAHATPDPKKGKKTATTYPRLTPGDGERRFEKWIRAIRKVNNLSDARRFRSEVASQLKKDSEQEGQDQVYMRRLEMGKRLLDQRVQHLAAGGDRRNVPAYTNSTSPTETSRLEHARLADLLRDTSGLSYFMEYMDRQRMMPLVQFWLVVDGFRNPLEDDGPESEQLPSTLPPWTDSDRMDLAQIDQAYMSRPELKVPDSSKKAIRNFLESGRKATPEQYFKARRAVLRAQSTVLEEMQSKYFQSFKKSDLWYKCLASEEASKTAASLAPPPLPVRPTSPPLARASQSYQQTKPAPTSVARLNPRLNTQVKRGLSATDLRQATNGSHSPDPMGRRSLDQTLHTPLFDDDDFDHDPMGDSIQSLDQDPVDPTPDTNVVQAMEEALNNIMEDDRPESAEDLRQSLFGNEDGTASIFSGHDNESTRGSIDIQRPGPSGKEPDKPSLSSLGLVSAASRIGVFEDNDLFGDEDKLLGEDQDELNEDAGNIEDEVHEAAPGDLGLAEAITVLTNDIDRLVAQEAVLDSLMKKAELTNNTAELRILRKSKGSLRRELRRKELQRQQYVVQESDNSLYGRSSIKIKAIQVGRDDDGKEFALYVVEVQRVAGEKMPAATWIVTRRYSEFHELHQKLRNRYPSVRDLDFPRRRVIMTLQSEFLRKRQQALEQYMQQLLRLPEVCRSRDLRAFLSQSVIKQGEDLITREDKKDMMSRFYDSVTDGMEDILGNIPVLDQLSVAGQNLIAAATSQLNTTSGMMPGGLHVGEDALTAAEAEAELNAFENKELEPFIKPICDIFLEVFELNRGNNWLRGRAVVVVLHQLLGGTIERKVRDNAKVLVQEDAILKYIGLARDSMWPDGGGLKRGKSPRTTAQKAKTRREAGLMLATLLPDLAGSVVGRLNAQAASRRLFATLNNEKLNTHLVYTILDELVDVLFG
ncbi:PXA domain-containing protein [Truncatella angustata]|uniref:PXA domain-containing protein n=1 Tax=Truncatella angustata TaxID=152316 RepID=A0A9P8UD53_9PEZI|nr:PXA domain-containing protein [Truncatella angustata]KAH6647693.1 PXA domain-containing protein [Truncatella angustata]KAH8200616.1 hypothetical protein TruAng_005213 [Truncatella angustata]